MTTVSWYNDPSILLKKDYVFEIWPDSSMKQEQKLNAITRLILLLTFLGFLFTQSIKIILVGCITLVVMYFLFKKHPDKDKDIKVKVEKTYVKEGFEGKEGMEGTGRNIIHPETLKSYLKADFEESKKTNPFGNVLLTEIQDDPLRKSALPSFNTEVHEDITQSVKKMVQKLNPGIKNTNKQLFGDLGEKFNLDQSNRSFFSTANTRIPNDQGAFANFLYGDMPSCRDGDPFACIQDNPRYNLY
jgi:hypothetical protein